MTRIANRDAYRYVCRHEEFKGSNLYAERWRLDDEGNEYVYTVYSYGEHFPLYVFDSRVECWYANADKYSRTTSRHQSQAHPPHVSYYVPTELMEAMARRGAVGAVSQRIGAVA
jgi:hypothetical protein